MTYSYWLEIQPSKLKHFLPTPVDVKQSNKCPVGIQKNGNNLYDHYVKEIKDIKKLMRNIMFTLRLLNVTNT